MTEKRFTQKDEDDWEILDRNKHFAYAHSGYQARKIIQELNELVETNRELYKENKELKEEIEKLQRFEHTGEHIRLSINIETGELQRHIYATGQWFGDFDRVLCENWISKEDYQKFINRVIEVYNTEFKKELQE